VLRAAAGEIAWTRHASVSCDQFLMNGATTAATSASGGLHFAS
jgi:hypothetical protein